MVLNFIFLYILLSVLIGLYFSRKTKTVKLILDLFENTSNALSVVELTDTFSKKMNKTTVYRILDRLEEALDSNELPETSGFFFGNNSDDYYAEADREFIVQARAALKQGYTVVYYSWW